MECCFVALRHFRTTSDHFGFFHSFTACAYMDTKCFFLGRLCFSFTFGPLKVICEVSNPEGFGFIDMLNPCGLEGRTIESL